MSRSIIEFFQHIRMSFGVDYELVWDVIENEIEELNFRYYSGAKLTINCVYVFDNNKSPINYNCFLAVSKRQ